MKVAWTHRAGIARKERIMSRNGSPSLVEWLTFGMILLLIVIAVYSWTQRTTTTAAATFSIRASLDPSDHHRLTMGDIAPVGTHVLIYGLSPHPPTIMRLDGTDEKGIFLFSAAKDSAALDQSNLTFVRTFMWLHQDNDAPCCR